MVHENVEPVFAEELHMENHMCRFALDIGGTLTKIAYYEEETPMDAISNDCVEAPTLMHGCANGVSSSSIKKHYEKRCYFKFEYFHTSDIQLACQWIKDKKLLTPGNPVSVTGGGAFKYEQLLKEQFNALLIKKDEMECIMAGLTYLIQKSNDVFSYDMSTNRRVSYNMGDQAYPFLLINIGSGVSIIKADSCASFRRITGTCIGGGTVLGLSRLLLGDYTFEEVINLSHRGTNDLDLVVGDLHGDAAGSLCLPSDTLASSFGRLYVEPTCAPVGPLRHEDVSRSLITMVAYNVGYLTCLVGQLHNVARFIFAGKFIHNYDVTMAAIQHAVDFYREFYGKQREVHGRQTLARGVRVHRQEVGKKECDEVEQNGCHRKWTNAFSNTVNSSQSSESTQLTNSSAILSAGKRSPLAMKSTPNGSFQTVLDGSEARSVKYATKRKNSATTGSCLYNGTRGDCVNESHGFSSNPSKALFLTHDGYLGSLGALLLTHKACPT